MKHLPYFPDLGPCDYDLISKPKAIVWEIICKEKGYYDSSLL